MVRGALRSRVGLACIPGLGPKRLKDLIEGAGSVTALAEDPARFRGAPGGHALPSHSDRVRTLAAKELTKLRNIGARVLIPESPSWPTCLEQLPQPPPLLSVLGSQSCLWPDQKRVTIIGARACTPYGEAQAERFGSGIATAGGIVVSGGARGIDQAAMRGALEAGGRVLAVVGSGLDVPYPPEAIPLYQRILNQGGAILSEFPCGTTPHRGNFPRRNRILAALSPVLLVVQAATKSGTFTTLRHVEDLSVQVCAVPGPVTSAVSRGPHALIRDGALIVEDPADVLACFHHWTVPEEQPSNSPLIALLDHGDLTIEELSRTLNRPLESLRLELSDLELRGLISRRPGGFYHRMMTGQKRPPS